MTHIDLIIADALAGLPETDVAILARELVRLREARAVVVPAWDVNAFALACVKAGVYAEGDLRDALKNAETGYNFAISSTCAIPADRVLGEGMAALRRFAERCAQRDHQPDEHIGSAKCVACEAEDALRASQGGADHD